MNGPNYYNEHDPKAASWLRELIAQKLIPDGTVDTRSIVEVQPADLDGFTQCHFFAGIGGWPLALHLAGYPTTRPIWTGSCPCQPFSAAGLKLGELDERHLWPAFYRLISQCRPPVVFGEQVASKAALQWLDGVFADLESSDYACGAADMCAAGTGAPHIRQRLFWVANADGKQCSEGLQSLSGNRTERAGSGCVTGRMADADRGRREQRHSEIGSLSEPDESSSTGRLGDPDNEGSQKHRESGHLHLREQNGKDPGGLGFDSSLHLREGGGLVNSDSAGREPGQPSTEAARHRGSVIATVGDGFWSDFDILPCTDGKARRIEPGTFPLVAGLPKGVVRGGDPSIPINPQATAEARVMRLKGYGNAIVPQLAAEFIKAFLET